MVRYGSEAEVRAHACNLPERRKGEWTSLRTGTMTTNDHVGHCDVIMAARAETDESFTLNFQNCSLRSKVRSRTDFTGAFNMTFSCLATLHEHPYEDACVFARTTPNDVINQDYVSVIFQHVGREVYIYYVGTCTPNSAKYIKAQDDGRPRNAIATLVFDSGAASRTMASPWYFSVWMLLLVGSTFLL